jgi:hypothetical protein
VAGKRKLTRLGYSRRTRMILCRCGYEADGDDDLDRHIESWLRFFADRGIKGRDFEHVEA